MTPFSLFDAATALVVVDVQNDFADPAGSLSVKGGAAIIPAINEAVAAARAAGALIVYTADWHPAETPHFVTGGGIWPVHCVGGTDGAAFHPDLAPEPDLIIRKGTAGEDGYSGFSVRDPGTGERQDTALRGALEARGIRRVVVCGLATDYCVKATALDGAEFGFETVLLPDLAAAVDLAPGDGARAIDAMRRAGVRIMGTGDPGWSHPYLATDWLVTTVRDGVRHLLLIERGIEPHKGAWALAGGFVEAGERVEAAAVRELAEETGIEAAPGAARLLGVYSDPGRDPRGWVISVAYTLEVDAATAAGATAGDDAAEAGWFPLDALPPLAFDHPEMLRDAFGVAS